MNEDPLVTHRRLLDAYRECCGLPHKPGLCCALDLEVEVRALRERAAELESDAANWRKVEAMPMNFRLAHEPVSAFPGDDDWDTKRHYEWAVLYQSTFTSNGATPQEALDRAMNNPQRWVPDFVLTMWREAYLAALEAARKEQTPCPKCHTS